MEYNYLYIVHKPAQKELKTLLADVYIGAKIRSKGSELLIVETPVDPIEPLDYHELYSLIQTDFECHLAMLVLNPPSVAMLDEAIILEYLHKVSAGYYDIEEFLLTVIKRHSKVMSLLQSQLAKVLGPELIETALALADANMNASIAAKQHYMHRNTMLYRIERIYEKTGINIRNFAGLSIFTQLYRY